MTQLRVSHAVAWVPWGAAAFARARDEEKCVLLAIAAPWSDACREMDRCSYGDPEIAAEINRWFIPVRVDADRRPDLVDRYDLGGLPTTAFLNVDGEILGGGTFVPPERLMEALGQARRQALSASTSPKLQSSEGGKLRSGEGGPVPIDQLVEQVFSTFDTKHAGFGSAPKFPLVAPVRLALDLFRETNAAEMAEYATRTLDAMAWNGLYDEAGGGFCRCSAHEDWSEPQREKLLVTNAALLDLYLEAGVTFGNQRWLGRAADVLEFAQGNLSVGPGEGWRSSVESDGARLSDANAAMASAALRASRVFDDSTLREMALQALEAVVLATYRPGHGVAHCTGGVRGLLTDHAAMAAAHLDAWDLTGDVVYQMMAQELVQFAVRTMLTGEGSFADRATLDEETPIGLLHQPLRPFALNCEIADVLHRLARTTEDPSWHQLAVRTLEAVEPQAAAQGPLAAHFILARRSLAR